MNAFSRQPTESALKEWRFGQTEAERLCAEILHIEGYEGIDPQCPLGGPDGKKDIICKKDGKFWIVACFFPPTPQLFSDIKNKFSSDFLGVSKNQAQGFVFFTNQKITPSERDELIKITEPGEPDIFHCERIRAILDSPKGYGIRLEYLRISLTEEEQYAFFSLFKDDIYDLFITQKKAMDEISSKMDIIMSRTMSSISDLTSNPSYLFKKGSNNIDISLVTSSINIGHLCWIHRIIGEDLRIPSKFIGILRTVPVWIGDPTSTPDNARFIPLPPEKILHAITVLLSEWCANYRLILKCPQISKIEYIVEFHHAFLTIHPFLDGNGRIARILMQQQVLELLERKISDDFFSDSNKYYKSLSEADRENNTPLIELLSQTLI
ncbi:Fic family protein [uncultured Methanospirillum sp.]|uniref:Fic family protein n=1 Tax=uncultured Methanospirillum sp. TaxID=262503 RepID=UPI0029C780A9|nr:Fic family protein [uncultured Methanospirillum sp.]